MGYIYNDYCPVGDYMKYLILFLISFSLFASYESKKQAVFNRLRLISNAKIKKAAFDLGGKYSVLSPKKWLFKKIDYCTTEQCIVDNIDPLISALEAAVAQIPSNDATRKARWEQYEAAREALKNFDCSSLPAGFQRKHCILHKWEQ
jgi:hypothetical protein